MATSSDGTSVPMTPDGRVKYNDWPLKINPKAHKLWAADVTGYDTDTKYNWIQEFLGTEQRDGNKYYDVRDVSVGDYIRVAAGSHNNDYTSVLEVVGIDEDELFVSKLSDDEAIAAVSDDVSEVERERVSLMADIDTEMDGMPMVQLRALHRHLDAGDGE